MSSIISLPPVLPFFDTFEHINQGNSVVNQYITKVSMDNVPDAGVIFELASEWLWEQKDSENNYKSYRSEVTTFLHWCFDVAKLSASSCRRKEIQHYVDYCRNPPLSLIGYFNVAQFITDKEAQLRAPNVQWRPFVGKKHLGKILPYCLSERALKTKLAILSSFFSYLQSEEYCERNPAQMWLKHSRFGSKKKYVVEHDSEKPQAFTQLQWSYVMESAAHAAKVKPLVHQRSLFLIKLIYCCYLRISDVAARAGYSPLMSQFRLNRQTEIWSFIIPQSKGGKRRSVTVSKQLLEALAQYRSFLGLSDYPSSQEVEPLFIRHKAAGRGRETGVINANLGIRQLREQIQDVISMAAARAAGDGFTDDAIEMEQLTAHNIRHTGITHDINYNRRPLSHVQADAGHESIDTTSQYLHTNEIDRHQTAYNKSLNLLDDI